MNAFDKKTKKANTKDYITYDSICIMLGSMQTYFMKESKPWLPLAVVPNLFGTTEQFCGRQFFHGLEGGDGLGMIQTHYIYWALYFYYYYIRSTSDQQALDPRGWGPPP